MNVPRAVVWLLLGVTALATAPARAQDKNEANWEVLVGYAKNSEPRTFANVALRPTVPQTVYVHLRNPALIPRSKVTVKLVRVIAPAALGEPAKTELLGETAIDLLRPIQSEMLKFKPVPPPVPKDAPKDAPPVKDKQPEPGAYDPPFLFQLVIEEDRGGKKLTAVKDLPIVIQQPHEYVNAQAAFDRATSKLTATVSADEPGFVDPPCEVQMVLLPELLPGLIPPKDKLLLEKLTKERPVVELHATNMQFAQSVIPTSGRVFLTIDGYERAYGFRANLDQGQLRRLESAYRIRIQAPRFFVPKTPPPADPKVPPLPAPAPLLPVRLEVDGPLDKIATVEVAFDRSGDNNFVVVKQFPALRQQSLKIELGPEGGLLCTPAVKDWQFDLNVKEISGRRALRVRLVGPDGKSVPLANEGELLLFARDSDHPFAPLGQAVDQGNVLAIYADLIINDTEPEGVRLVGLPAKTAPGKSITLKATAKRRDPKLQAPISKVQFFVGDPAKDKPLPASFDEASGLWQTEYKVPPAAKEKLAVAVKMTTSAGLSAGDSGEVMLVDAAAGATITGTILWSSNKQPNLEVKLLDAKGKALQTVRTNASGVYAFENIPPGDYFVFASKISFRGVHRVAVLKGQALVDKQDFEIVRR